jgi:enoyl-CoA hydratase/carnithine racemase
VAWDRMDYRNIIVEKEDGWAMIRLNRPHKLNAYNSDMEEELLKAVSDIESDNNVKVVIITGTGRGFCSGHDLEEVVNTAKEYTGINLPLRFDLKGYPPGIIKNITKPTIAAINGIAAGGGLALALACDLRIAVEEAVFYENHVAKVGILPGLELLLLPRLIGIEKALELIYTGKKIGAKEAQSIGLLGRVVSGDQLLQAATEMAKEISNAPLLALRHAKKVAYMGLGLPTDDAMSYITLSRIATTLSNILASQQPK